MRLLVTVPWSQRLGGAEAMLWNFLRHLDTHQFETTVAFYEDGSFASDVADLPGITTAVIPTGRLREPSAARRAVARIAALMRAQQPDVIVSWAAKAHLYTACAASVAGMGNRSVWWQHAIPDGHWIERLATACPARAVGCSSRASAAAQRALRPHREVFVVNPGIDADIVDPVPREVLGVSAGSTVVGIVGRLQPWKGQHRLLEAIAELRRRGRDVHGLIVGGDAYGLSPEYAPYLERRVTELGLGEHVTMTGHVPDPKPYVAAMDVLVNASVGEPFGITLIEGLSQAVPVVAVGDGGARDIVDHGETGLLIARADAGLLASALEELLADPDRRRRFGRAGREQFVGRFTAAAMTARLEAQLALLSRPAAAKAVV